MHNIVLEHLYLINLGRKQNNPSTLHHTVKAKFAEFEVIYCILKRLFFFFFKLEKDALAIGIGGL